MYQYHVAVAPIDPEESRLLLNKLSRNGWRVTAVLYNNHLILEREAREEDVMENPPVKQEALPVPVEVLPPTDFAFEPDEATEEAEAELQDR